MRRSLRTPAGIALIAALVVVAGALAYAMVWGLRNQVLQNDEASFGIQGARMFRDDPWGFLTSASPVNRGPERLPAMLLAIPQWLFGAGGAATAFRVSHLMFSAIAVSAALPAYGLGRLLSLERWQAAVGAALTVATPWLIFDTALLNGALAFPLLTGLAWVTVRGVLRPSLGGDALILLVALVNALARTGNLPFLALPAVAVLVQVARDRPAGTSFGAAARGYPWRLLRTHPLLVVPGLVVLAGVLAIGPAQIVGGQYSGGALPKDVTPSVLANRTGFWGSVLALGSGYVPLMIAVPWLVRHAVRPADRAAGAFAVVGLAALVLYVVSTVQAPPEERYVAILAAVPAIAFARAVFAREASVLGTLAVGGYLADRILTYELGEDTGPFSYMVAPARQFLHRVIAGRLTEVPGLPDAHTSAAWVIGTVVVAVLLAATARGPGIPRLTTHQQRRVNEAAPVLAAVVAVGIVVLGFLSAQYNSRRWTDGTGASATTWEQRTFIDRATGGAAVAGFTADATSDGLVPYAMGQALNYNGSIVGAARPAGQPSTWGCCRPDTELRPDPVRGTLATSGPPLPRFLLEPPSFTPFGFQGPIRRTSPTLAGFTLREIGRRPRLSYTTTGVQLDGFLLRRRAAHLRLFGAPCATATLVGMPTQPPPGPPETPGDRPPAPPPPGRPATLEVRDASGTRRLTVAPDAMATMQVRPARGRPAVLRASGGGPLSDGRRVTVRLTALTPAC